jgi:hypothetical protein
MTREMVDSTTLADDPTGRPAMIVLDGWAGLFEQRGATVVGETRTRYRIRADRPEGLRLAGRNRYLAQGKTALIPKHAVILL